MTDDRSVASVRKASRPLVLLPRSLAQVIGDCFDDHRFDQAVQLLESVRADGLSIPSDIAQKLVALALCSLSPGQIASTSQWTYEHQLHDTAVRLLAQPKAKKGVTSEKPTEAAILKAVSLLLQNTEASDIYADSDPDWNAEESSENNHAAAFSVRQTLKSLPSRRRPLIEPQSASSTTPRRARSGSVKSDSEHETSFELSSIDRWIREDLNTAEDAWDLLCDRHFSKKGDESEADASVRLGEFWMSNAERKRYQKQLQATDETHQRLEDKLRELRRKAFNEGISSDEDSNDDDDADPLEGLYTAARKKKRLTKSKKTASHAPPAKPPRTDKPAALSRPDEDAQHSHIRMKEGAWRTLSVLLRLWQRVSSQEASAPSDAATAVDEQRPLLWQFPPRHRVNGNNGSSSKRFRTSDNDVTDDINRALNVGFSFPRILPALTPLSTGIDAASDLFDTATFSRTRGDSRLMSSVPSTQLLQRQDIGGDFNESCMSSRADTAARLFESIHELVHLGHVHPAPFIEGIADRVEALHVHTIEGLMQPLIDRQPLVVAKVLTMYLNDSARIPSNKQKLKAEADVTYHFDNHLTISHGAALAYAMPNEEEALALLRRTVQQSQDNDARAVLDFLSLNNLEFHSSANSSSALIFPTKDESRKVTVVRKRPPKPFKSEARSLKKGKTQTSTNGNTDADAAASAATVVTSKMKKGGLLAFAFLRVVQMQSRESINRMKLLIAQALVNMHHTDCLNRETADASSSTSSSSLSSQSSTPRALVDPVDEAVETGVTHNIETRKQMLRLFLSQLGKALLRDVEEFKKCVQAMETHCDGPTSVELDNGANDGVGATRGMAALPSMDVTLEKAQECLQATQDWEKSTEYLRDSMA